MNAIQVLGGGVLCAGVGTLVGVLCHCSTTSSQDADCQQACTTASNCDLLPSALATDMQNCAERCRLSEQTTIEPVLNCLKASVESDGGTGPWCGSNPVCSNAAQCLGNLSTNLLPASTVTVVARTGSVEAFDSTCQIASAPSTSEGVSPSEAQQWCQNFNTVIPFIEQNQVYSFSDPLPCNLALTQGTLFVNVPAGDTRAGFEVYGTIDAGATGGAADEGGIAGASSTAPPTPQFCWVFHGDRVVLQSGASGGIGIPLPESAPATPMYECERSETACSDGVDNDHDGKKDCQDTKCTGFSVCAPNRSGTACVDAGLEGGCDGG